MNYKRKQDCDQPPTRLCLCGHNRYVHSRGYCGVVTGCDCERFRENTTVPKLSPRGEWFTVSRRRRGAE